MTSASVKTIVTRRAQSDEVLLGVIPGVTAKFLVMDLEIARTAAGLTFPSIPPQDLRTKLLVGFWIEDQTGMFWSDRVHEVCPFTCARNACFCSPGRNLKNRDMDCRSTVGSS